MRTAWIVGMAMLYVVLSVVSGIDEGTYFGGTGVATIWQGFTSLQVIEFTNVAAGVWGVLVALKDLVVGLFEILTWKFSFFTGGFAIFRFILGAISLGIMTSLILALRGTSSG
jgi:hypothetical protein